MSSTNATPRETADHAERSPSIVTGAESDMPSGVSLDHAELAAECVRGLQSIEDRVCEGDPFRFTGGSIYFKSIKVIRGQASEIAALRGERDRLAEELHNEIMVCAGKSCVADVAERQRDDMARALRSIAEGNLGADPWQANYETIKQVARNAISNQGADQ